MKHSSVVEALDPMGCGSAEFIDTRKPQAGDPIGVGYARATPAHLVPDHGTFQQVDGFEAPYRVSLLPAYATPFGAYTGCVQIDVEQELVRNDDSDAFHSRDRSDVYCPHDGLVHRTTSDRGSWAQVGRSF